MHLFIHQNALCQFWGEIKLNLMLVANFSGVRVEEGGGGGAMVLFASRASVGL